MNENELMQAEDEVSLFDLWEKVRRGWRYVFAGAGVGALVSGAAVMMIAPKYEAASTLQIGVIAGKEVEAATTTLERFKSPAFMLEAAKLAGVEKLVERMTLGDGAGGDYVKAQLVKGTSLVELKTIGDMPESAKKLNDVLVQQLAQRHEALGSPLKEKLKSDIALTKEKLKSVEIELAELSKISNVSTSKDAQFSPVSLLVLQKIQKQSEVFGLRQQLTNLEVMQLAPATQQTQAIEQPFVPTKPISPKKTLLVVLGVIGGLLVGLVAVFVRDGWVRSRRERTQIS